LHGLFETDGHYSEKRKTNTIDSTSLALIYGTYATLVSLGYTPCINMVSRSKGTYANAKPLYRLIWIEDKKNNQVWMDNKFVCRPIRKFELVEGPNEVYDIGVKDEHHSFIANGHAVSNCVGKAGKNSGILLLGVEAALAQPDEETGITEGFPEVPLELQPHGILAWEHLYGERGHRGQGANCSKLILVSSKSSGMILRKNYPEAGIDFTKENTRLSVNWGARGTPDKILALGKSNPIRNAVDVPNHEVARDFINNGYPIWVCSSLGFSEICDANGYSERQGGWGHSWIVAGFDDRPETVKAYGFPLFLFIHDWGLWNKNTKGITIKGTNIKIPPGSFWADARLLDQCDMTALSGLTGWMRKELPDFSGGLLG
jgi:hypothetical protein